jgi:regulator of nonsense transcripts 2
VPGRINPFDQPDDYFRIRLISTILETCGMFFNKGAAGKKLDYFLSFFQYYIHTKNPLPMDIEFLVQDIFALTRPQWKLASNLDEATKVFHLAVMQDQKTSGLDKVLEQDDATSGVSSDDMHPEEHDDDDDLGSEDADAEAEVGLTNHLTPDISVSSTTDSSFTGRRAGSVLPQQRL